MNTLNVAKSIKRIVVVHRDPSGFASTTLIHGRRRRKKKQSKGLRALEKMMRKAAKARRAGADEYLKRHKRANERKKNGWARKLPLNAMKAQRKSLKVMFK